MRAHSGFSTCFAMPGSVRREPLPRQSLTAHRWPDGYELAALWDPNNLSKDFSREELEKALR
ncbi:hypothetical protein HI292_39435 [Corallococcus exiguus]|nr:hypothetical protein [Corallococcus exiguus]